MAAIEFKRCKGCRGTFQPEELDYRGYCARCGDDTPAVELRRVRPSQADRIMHGGVTGGRGNVNGPRRLHLHGTVMLDGTEYELSGYLIRTEG